MTLPATWTSAFNPRHCSAPVSQARAQGQRSSASRSRGSRARLPSAGGDTKARALNHFTGPHGGLSRGSVTGTRRRQLRGKEAPPLRFRAAGIREVTKPSSVGPPLPAACPLSPEQFSSQSFPSHLKTRLPGQTNQQNTQNTDNKNSDSGHLTQALSPPRPNVGCHGDAVRASGHRFSSRK